MGHIFHVMREREREVIFLFPVILPSGKKCEHLIQILSYTASFQYSLGIVSMLSVSGITPSSCIYKNRPGSCIYGEALHGL